MNRLLALLLLMAMSVAACGREAPPAAPAAPPAPAATRAPAAATPAAPTAPQTEAAQTEATQPAGVDESAGDNAQEVPGTASLEHLAALPAQQQLPDGRWKAGVNYTPIVPAEPTSVPAGKVEVIEFFWYACPHCYALEPYLVSWKQSKPDYVEFVRVPIVWGPVHRAHARLFYTLEALGRKDLHQKVFDTIHSQQNLLVGNTDDATLNLQLQFATANGIDADTFRKAYDSFGVASNLQRAEDLMRRYHIESVPQIVINGKYATDVGKAGDHDKLIGLINDLAASEHHSTHGGA
jgi:thiol:disulfide interchange protein DsbA